MSASNWNSYRLDEISVIQGGGTPSRSESSYFGGSIPWVTPTDLPAIGVVATLNGTKETITEVGLAKSSAKLIEPESVLFSTRASVGKIAVTYKPCATNQGFANFTPHRDKVDPWFLAFLLRRFTPEITCLAGKTTFLEVPRGRLKAFEVPLPILSEQRRIVSRIKECMERVDEIESLRNQALNEAEHLGPSLYAALEQGKKWPRKTVGQVILRSRNGKSIQKTNENFNGYVLSLRAVHDIALNFDERKPIILPDNIADQYAIRSGDVFVSRSNTRDLVGLSSIAITSPTIRLIYPDLLIKLEANTDEISPRFPAYVLRTSNSRRQIKERAVGTSQSMVKISGERLKDVEIPVPPRNEQDLLVEQFDELHDLSFALVSEMRAVEKFRLNESILRKAFAGEL